jgi:hypothetical protein
MRISPATVNSVRGIATWAMRGVSIVLLALGAYLVLSRVLWAVGSRLLSQGFAFYTEPHEVGAPFTGAAMLAIGAGLGRLAGPIARWMIPVPPESCPRCGYGNAEPVGRCPECGLVLSDTRS